MENKASVDLSDPRLTGTYLFAYQRPSYSAPHGAPIPHGTVSPAGKKIINTPSHPRAALASPPPSAKAPKID